MSTVARTKNATNEDFHGPSTTHQTVLTRTALPAARPSLRASRFQGRSLPMEEERHPTLFGCRRFFFPQENSVHKKRLSRRKENSSQGRLQRLLVRLCYHSLASANSLAGKRQNKDSCVPCRNLNLLPFRGDECVCSFSHPLMKIGDAKKLRTRLSHAAVHQRTSPVS